MQPKMEEVPTLLGLHPAATLFPEMSSDEFKALVDDIREHGQLEPIIVLEGQVIDGRHRLQACEALGIAPNTEEFYGDDEDIYPFVISKNLKRRHLSASQLAMIGASIAQMKVGDNQHSGGGANLPNLADTAKVLNISERSIKSARAVREAGTPELAAAVSAGTIPVSAAAVFAKTEPARQAKIVAMPTAERREELQRVKAEQDRVREIARDARAARGENAYVQFLEKNLRMPNADEALTISKLDGLVTPDEKGKRHSPIPPPTKQQAQESKRDQDVYGDVTSIDRALQNLGSIVSPVSDIVPKAAVGAFRHRIAENLDRSLALLTSFAEEWRKHHVES